MVCKNLPNQSTSEGVMRNSCSMASSAIYGHSCHRKPEGRRPEGFLWQLCLTTVSISPYGAREAMLQLICSNLDWCITRFTGALVGKVFTDNCPNWIVAQ